MKAIQTDLEKLYEVFLAQVKQKEKELELQDEAQEFSVHGASLLDSEAEKLRDCPTFQNHAEKIKLLNSFLFDSFKTAWKSLKFARLNFCFVSSESKIEGFQVIYGQLMQGMEERKFGMEFFLFTAYSL